ncbi:glycosyltransferase [Rubritalea spongiae]|uniref:glycosyltransferase n=1 Tax=Rubritalea spongiae TaxID=430797 RepID=UPI0036203637
MKTSVIISTYNHPKWLQKTLWGYANQSYSNFEIIIADDGSDERTKTVIDQAKHELKQPIKHVWHEDNGFQKSAILNKATIASSGEYLIFTDGDCVPRQDFIATHLAHAQQGHILSGGYCKLPMQLSKDITRDDILSGRAFDANWLAQHGLKSFSSKLKLSLPLLVEK